MGHCVEESKYTMDLIVYTPENIKYRIMAPSKNIKEFEVTGTHNQGILSRFGYLKGKSMRIEFFHDSTNPDKRIMKKMILL